MRRLALFTLFLPVAALAQPAPPITVAMYAPATAFADSSARLAYVQGLARAIQQRTGAPTTGKAFVRLGDLLAARPDFAIVDGQCLAARQASGTLLATAAIGGELAQPWGLYSRGGERLASLRGKKLVYVKTGCRDGDFLDNALLDGEVRTQAFFGALIDKPDTTGAVLTVRDYRAADAVFAPASQARGLTRVYDAGPVPNPGFVALKQHPAALLEGVRQAVLNYGSAGGIDGWRPAAPAAYAALGGRLQARPKRLVFAPPEMVRLDDADVLVLPPSRYDQATIKQHFWEPSPAGPAAAP
jgi:hypothetical protein